MELYNQVLADQMNGYARKMIKTTPQPTMFGGRRVRKYVLAGTSDSDYPSSLSVGSLTGEKPTHLSGAFWDGVPPRYAGGMIHNPVFHGSHGARGLYYSEPTFPIQAVEQGGKIKFGKIAKGVGKVALPIAKEVLLPVAKDMAKNALKSYMSGSSSSAPPAEGAGRKRGRPKGSGGKIKMGKVLKSVGKVALPIAKEVLLPVAKDMAKNALKSYMSGSSSSAPPAGGKIKIGKIAKGVGKVALPIAKDVGVSLAKDALKSYMSGSSSSAPPAGGKIRVKKVFSKIGKSVGKIGADIAPVALPIAFGALATATGNPELAPVGMALGEATGQSLQRQYGSGKPRGRPRKTGGALLMNHPEQFQNSVYPPALQSYQGTFKGGRKQLPQSGAKRLSARGAIVAEVMKKHGLSLPQASSFVKEHGLY